MEKKMSRREFLKASATTGVILAGGGSLLSATHTSASAKEFHDIQLSKPQTTGSNGFMRLLEKRASSRVFGPEPLPVAVLSNLLWAAFGVNRPDGKRTAPSASNRQEIDIYVALPDGLYLYDPKAHTLKPILAEDIRALTGSQPYVGQAAANLVYVADTSKMSALTPEQKNLLIGANAGFISENVYLYCAAEGLATVVRAMIDRPLLGKAMKLRSDQVIVLAQSVGYPGKGA